MRSILQSMGLGLLVHFACTANPPERHEISVLTLNLLTFAVAPDVDARTQGVIDLIAVERPDFIALQEVAETSQIENRAAVIAAASGYDFIWSATEVDTMSDYHGGPAVLSRWPILSEEIVSLPHLDFDDSVERRAIRITADTPAGPIHLVGTHTTTSDDPERSADQAVAGARLLLEAPGGLAGFYAGDFNAEPATLAMQVLRGEQSYGALGGALDDAWLGTRREQPGHTYPARNPARRIDYIYSSSSRATSIRAQNCELLLDQPLDGVYVSDHLALLCRFHLVPRD